ncbi:MAG: ParB/RepB/Spo0J family partition protein [Alphaproteobacteria bacterium]|nr:MAG: ParB/RepB/Spo0J family partition protein [Alphaproteobacteria bacterium]
MTSEPQKRLGRGLDALLGEYGKPLTPETSAGQRLSQVPLALIHPNPRNPRQDFATKDLDELAVSIRTHGIVQPIVVRAMAGPGETYEIIAGERRWRAAQRAGLHDVPVSVLSVSDRQALELAIVENVQRTDLNAIEEALGYQALIEEFSYSQADLGTVIGKSRVHVTNTLRLLKLPEDVLNAVKSGALSAGHGRALLGADDPSALARRVVDKGLSVRDTEKLAQSPVDPGGKRARTTAAMGKDADTRALEKQLSDALGIAVDIRHKKNGKGEIRLRYGSLEQLDDLCRLLKS